MSTKAEQARVEAQRNANPPRAKRLPRPRRDTQVDTSLPGVSATDRKGGDDKPNTARGVAGRPADRYREQQEEAAATEGQSPEAASVPATEASSAPPEAPPERKGGTPGSSRARSTKGKRTAKQATARERAKRVAPGTPGPQARRPNLMNAARKKKAAPPLAAAR